MDRDCDEVNYYLTEFFTRHGYSNARLVTLQKVKTTPCSYQDSAQDDVYYNFFECDRWMDGREELERKIGPLTPMLPESNHWCMIASFIEVVLNSKESNIQ